MPDKDQFTFDEEDDFPETDLSGIFGDAEEEAETDEEEAFEPSVAEQASADPLAPEEADKPASSEQEPPGSQQKGGGSRTRILLLILLLVMAGAAGLYYMRLPEESPFETEAVPTSQQVVAVPAPDPGVKSKAPGQDAGSQQPAADEKEPVVSGEGAETSSAPAAEAAPELRDAPATADENVVPPASPADQVATGQTEEPAKTVAGDSRPAAAEAADKAGSGQPLEQLAPEPVAQQPPPDAAAFVLDAGAFLFPAQLEEIKKKIRALGYEPVETEVKASVRLIRLQVGGFPEAEIAEKLAEVRKIAPDAFSLVRNGQHVIYAGSFANQDNVQRLSARFREEGFVVSEEPVKVEKVLSLIRFGAFQEDSAAEAAAEAAGEAGIPARVVEN